MSGEALYERYKDALKRGHGASLRGRLEEALTAYAEAAAIAPERPTPHTSAGSALMRRKRYADALRNFGVALQLAPRDETALLGRAQALIALSRPGEAADAFDALAEARVAAGKLGDAVDAARRGLELAEGRERRRMLERLAARLRSTEPTELGRQALEHAADVLERGAVDVTVTEPPPALSRTRLPETPAPAEAPSSRPAIHPFVLDRHLSGDLDADALARAAEDAIDAGEHGRAVEHLLDLASSRWQAGNVEAALDACYEGLSIAPDDVNLHLALVRLYGDRGWARLAAEKLDLLERLVTLDDHDAAIAEVAAVRTRAG